MFRAYYLKFILLVSIAVAAVTAVFFYLMADSAGRRFFEAEKAFLYRHAQVLKRLTKIELEKLPNNLEKFATNDTSYAFSKGEYNYNIFVSDFLNDGNLRALNYDVLLWLDKQGVPLFARERGAGDSFSPLSSALEYGIINNIDLVGKEWDTITGFAVINGAPCMAASLPVMPATLADGVENHPTGRIVAAKYITNKFGAEEIKLLGFDLAYTAHELDKITAEDDLFIREIDGNLQVGVLVRDVSGAPSFALFSLFPIESKHLTAAFERAYTYFPIFLSVFCAIVLAGAITYFAVNPVKDLLKESEELAYKPIEFSGPKPFESLVARINASREKFVQQSLVKGQISASINNIKGALSLLFNASLNKRQERYTLFIKNAVKSLSIETALNGGEEESDALNFAEFHLEQLLSNLASAFAVTHPKANILLNYPPQCPSVYYGDPVKIRFIAAALLDSVLKRLNSRSVLIDFSFDEGMALLKIALRDDKTRDLPPENLEGGLLKAKEYLELMQGDLRFYDAGEESVFAITLPLEALKRTEYKKLSAAAVLVTEENYFLKKKLEFWGVNTFISVHIEKAIEEINLDVIPYKYLFVEFSIEVPKILKRLDTSKITPIMLCGGAKHETEEYKTLSKYATNREIYKAISGGEG